jgi:hypothetical protein
MNRVWVYQADRFLSDQEVGEMDSLIAEFSSKWTAHGSALAARGEIRGNLFLILEVNEELARVTGCSIDKSVYFIKGLEQQFSVGFFDRTKVAFRDENGEVKLVNRKEFAELVSMDKVNADTIVFNNLIQSAEELDSQWEIPFKASWHSKVFRKILE